MKTLIDNFAVLFPAAAAGAGVVSMEFHAAVAVGSPTSVTLGKAITTLVGVVPFVSGIITTANLTAAAADGDQVANPGKLDLTVANAATDMLVVYI